MSTDIHPDNAKTPRGGVPNPLLDDLHKANEKFHQAREHVDEAHGALVNPLLERERAIDDVREAEKEVEAAEEKIRQQLKNTPAPKAAAEGNGVAPQVVPAQQSSTLKPGPQSSLSKSDEHG